MRRVVALAIDDERARAMYAYALFAAGFDVTADDPMIPRPGNELARRPDLIVADVSPGSRHGWTFVQKLKCDRRTSSIPIIAMALDAGVTTRDRARRERCAAVCPTTCPPDVLTCGVRAVLDRLL